METEDYDVLGLHAIFSAFAVEVVFTVLSAASTSRRFSSASRVLGVSLTVAAVLLYPVFGCVFGRPV